MLLIAYLSRGDTASRPLRPEERARLGPMIRASSDAAANAIYVRVGDAGLRRVARRAGMRDFRPGGSVWGLGRVTATDVARLFQRIDARIPARHRAYAMTLLRTVVERQRWGIADARPRGWRLYFKGGWGSGRGYVDHQGALLRRGDERVAVAILVTGSGSQAYGNATLRGVARRLLRGLERAPTGSVG